MFFNKKTKPSKKIINIINLISKKQSNTIPKPTALKNSVGCKNILSFFILSNYMGSLEFRFSLLILPQQKIFNDI